MGKLFAQFALVVVLVSATVAAFVSTSAIAGNGCSADDQQMVCTQNGTQTVCRCIP